MKIIYQGEPIILDFSLKDDGGIVISDMTDYEIAVALSCRNMPVKSWSNCGADNTGELELSEDGGFRATASAGETADFPAGEYVVELRVSKYDVPAIAVARDVFLLQEDTVQEIPD